MMQHSTCYCRAIGIHRIAICVVAGLLLSNGRIAVAQSDAATRQYAAAVGFQNQKLYGDAITEWKTFLKKFPTDERRDYAQHYLGTCCLQEKQFADAAAAFAAVDQDSKFKLLDQSLLNLGIAQYGYAQSTGSAKDYNRAELSFRRMQSKFPRSRYVPRAVFFQAECLFQREQYSKAADVYRGFLTRYPTHELAADAGYGLGTAYEELGNSEQAERAFQNFMQRFPRHKLAGEVRMRRADVLFRNEDYAAAAPLFAELAKQSDLPSADVAMLRHARCLYEMKQFTDAAKTYWNIPRAFPGTKLYDSAVLAGAKCLFLDKKYTSARTGFEKIARREKPEAAEATEWLARCLVKENDYSRAESVIASGLQRFRDQKTRAALELVRIDALYEQPQQRRRAMELYAKFARSYPRHEQAAQAQYMAALTSLEEKEYSSAKQYAGQFLRQFRNSDYQSDVEFIAAEAELLLDNHAAAEKKFRAFLQSSPRHSSAPRAVVRLGFALYAQDEFNQAARWLQPMANKLSDKELRNEALALLGRCYAKLDRPDDAARILQMTSGGEQSESALIALADIYRDSNRHAEAEKQFEHIVRRFPTGEYAGEAQFRRAEIAFDDERYEDALQRYRDVVTRWPDSEFAPHAQYGMGWTYFQAEQFNDTITMANRLLKNWPKADIQPRGYYLRAMANYQLREYRSAISDISLFLKTNPRGTDYLDAQYVNGLALAGLKNFDEAAQVYSGILNRAKSADYAAADKVAYELAWVHLDRKDTDAAVTAFQRLARDWPDSPLASESLFRVGEAWYDAKQYSKAAQAYSASAGKAKDAEIAEKSLHKLGWSYLKNKDPERAASAFKKQLVRFGRGELAGDAQFLIGESAFQNEDWQTALRTFDSASKRRGTYQALATMRAGQCESKLQRYSAAQTRLRNVLSAFPDFDMRAEARYELGWALQSDGQYETAMTEFEKVTDETQSETAAKARFMMGECCFALKRHKDATRHFLKTAFTYNHREWSPMAYFEAARCFEVLRDVDQARNCYEQLLKKYPQHSKARDARRRLTAL